jgi:tetratricopeptide (TPR) repeat protein
MGAKKTQVLLIAGALVLSVLLYIAPKTAPKAIEKSQGEPTKASVDLNGTLDVYVNTAIKNLEPGLKQNLDKQLFKKDFDSAAFIFDRLKRPDLAAYYVERNAEKLNNGDSWMKAGNRYYYSAQFTEDKTEIPLLYQCAMRCFKKATTITPNNKDAQIMLASCYVEGTSDPMKGVSLLREVEKTDSNNVKLQLTFAFLSVKSQQLDKAIRRFNKVLEIDTNYIEAYLHLAQAYEQQNNKDLAIKSLESYAARTGDVTVKLEIKKYIEQLKLSNN